MDRHLWFPPDGQPNESSVRLSLTPADRIVWQQWQTCQWCRKFNALLDAGATADVCAACNESELRTWIIENTRWLEQPVMGSEKGRSATPLLLIFHAWLRLGTLYPPDEHVVPPCALAVCIQTMVAGVVPARRVFDVIDVVRCRAWTRFLHNEDLEWARYWVHATLPRLLCTPDIVVAVTEDYDFLNELTVYTLPLLRDMHVYKRLAEKAGDGFVWADGHSLADGHVQLDFAHAHSRLLAWGAERVHDMYSLSATGALHGGFKIIREKAVMASMWTGDTELTFAHGNYAHDWRSVYMFCNTATQAIYFMRYLLSDEEKGSDATMEHVGTLVGEMPKLTEIMFAEGQDYDTFYRTNVREAAWVVLWDNVLAAGGNGFASYGEVEQSGTAGTGVLWSETCCQMHVARRMFMHGGHGWETLCAGCMPIMVSEGGSWFVILQQTDVFEAEVLACGVSITEAFIVWAWAVLCVGEALHARQDILLMPAGYSIQHLLIYLFAPHGVQVDTEGAVTLVG